MLFFNVYKSIVMTESSVIGAKPPFAHHMRCMKKENKMIIGSLFLKQRWCEILLILLRPPVSIGTVPIWCYPLQVIVATHQLVT